MSELKIYLDAAIDKKLREEAMARFGYGRGSISSAAEEAIVQWLRRNHAIKKRLDSVVAAARTDKNVIAVFLFGSYARKAHDYIDVDVAILLDKKADRWKGLLTYSSAGGDYEDKLLDISIMNDMPLDVQSRILNEGEILYSGNKSKLYDYSISIINRWGDFSHRLHAVLNG